MPGSSRVDHALNESRILGIGTQILFGFSLQVCFEPGFPRLPAILQSAALVSLAAIVTTLTLVILPGARHAQVECFADTRHFYRFALLVLGFVLPPFVVALAATLFITFGAAHGLGAAAAAAGGIALFAAAVWYAPRLVCRPSRFTGDRPMSATRIETRVHHLLTESKLVLPGAQALLGFQLVIVLLDAFEELGSVDRILHLVALALVAVAVVLLMAPAAFHRTVEGGEDTERLIRFGRVVLVGAMAALSLGVAADLHVVVHRVTDSRAFAFAFAGVAWTIMAGVWFALPAFLRSRAPREVDGP